MSASVKKSNFDTILNRFVQQIDSLRDSLPIMMTVANGLLEHQIKKYNKALDTYGTPIEKKEKNHMK